MSDTKFTPGPWKYCPDHVFGTRYVRQDPKQWDGRGYQAVCGLPALPAKTHHGDMFNANGYLIAMAPEMYDAMQLFVDRVDRREIRSRKTYESFKAILKKARGEV